MKYIAQSTQDGGITLIVPENGGDAVCRVFKPEFAKAIADAVNRVALVEPHPIECEDIRRRIAGMEALAEAELMPADPSTLVWSGLPNSMKGR